MGKGIGRGGKLAVDGGACPALLAAAVAPPRLAVMSVCRHAATPIEAQDIDV